MKTTASHVIRKILEEEGIRWTFGIPGTHNIELYDALVESESVTPILVSDEQSAGFLCDGVARASGGMAVANLVPGAGLTHALSGIGECYLDQVPLLVLMCGIRNDSKYKYQLHEVDQASVVRPLCKKVFQPATHAELPAMLREACALARQAPQGPVAIEIPANFYLLKGEIEDTALASPPRPWVEAQPLELGPIIEILNSSRSIGIYAGMGAVGAQKELREIAEKLDAIVFTTISGKGVYPENHRRWGWNGLGRTLPPPIRRIEEELDCLLAIGCRFGEVATGSYGLTPPKNLIHVDIDPAVLSRNFPAQAQLAADARGFLSALLANPALRPHESDLKRLATLEAAHGRILEDRLAWEKTKTTEGVSPGLLFRMVQKICGDETVYVTDSGNGTFLAMENLRLPKARSFLAPVDYSCMGYSVPAGIGAKISCPDRPVAIFPGDGAFLMTGLELVTATNYGAAPMIFLLRDGELSQIAQFQRTSLGRESCTTLAAYRAEQIAAAFGIDFLVLERDQDVEGAVAWAFKTTSLGKPAFVEVRVDYSEPTFFSKGAVVTTFLRLQLKDQVRLASRVIGRKIFPASK